MSSNALALVLVALVAAGCTTAQSQQGPRLTGGETRPGCALGVGGATVTAEDIPDGIALSFTSTDKPAEMRERANDAAAQHGPGSRVGRGHDGRHGEGADHGLKAMQLPVARSVAEDIDNGARIRFVAVDPADTESLRARLRERTASMNAQSCK